MCRHGFLVHDWLDMIHDSFIITKQRRKFADLVLCDCLYFRKLVFFSVNFFLRANFHFSIKCPSFPSSDTQVQMVGRGKVGMGEEKESSFVYFFARSNLPSLHRLPLGLQGCIISCPRANSDSSMSTDNDGNTDFEIQTKTKKKNWKFPSSFCDWERVIACKGPSPANHV